MVIGLAPLDAQYTAIHHDIRLAASLSRQCRSNSGSTGSCTTSLCNATTPLPNASANGGVVSLSFVCGFPADNLRKLNITTLWESWVPLQCSSCLAHLIHIVGKDNIVRIAHRHECTFIQNAITQELRFILQHGFTHIHRDALDNAINNMQIEYLDTRQREQTNLSLLVTIPLLDREGPGVGLLLPSPWWKRRRLR